MRCVAYLPLYPPDSRVGAWLATHEYLAHLVRRGHRVDVFTYLPTAHDHHELDGVHVHCRHSGRLKGLVADADVMISHLGGKTHGSMLAAEHGIPSVRFVHGESRDNTRNLQASRTALVVFNSKHLAATVKWPGRSIIAHPPVHGARFRTTPGEHVTLVNLSAAKGGRVFNLVAYEMDGHWFLGVKGGYGRQVIPRSPNVEVVDVTPNMRDDVYARTRILLMPSEHESWGMTAVEAMHSGIPVIASPTPGLIEALGDAGIFADRADPSAWIEAIRQLDDPKAWKAASERSLARAAELDPTADMERFATAVEALL